MMTPRIKTIDYTDEHRFFLRSLWCFCVFCGFSVTPTTRRLNDLTTQRLNGLTTHDLQIHTFNRLKMKPGMWRMMSMSQRQRAGV